MKAVGMEWFYRFYQNQKGYSEGILSQAHRLFSKFSCSGLSGRKVKLVRLYHDFAVTFLYNTQVFTLALPGRYR